MKEQKGYSELKKRALLAKQRLTMGYFERLAKQQQELDARGESLATKIQVKSVEKESIMRQNANIICDYDVMEREMLYKKVCDILDKDINVTNPIGQLIDNDEYRALDFQSRQRYILKMVNEYNILRERYCKERALKKVK